MTFTSKYNYIINEFRNILKRFIFRRNIIKNLQPITNACIELKINQTNA